MKIAIFTDCFFPSVNGVVISVMNSCTRLAKKGHKILIFTSFVGKKVFLHKNIEVEYLKPIDIIDYPNFFVSLPNYRVIRKVKEFRPDILHVHTPSLLGFVAVFCSKIFNIPVIGSYHTILPDFLKHVRFLRAVSESAILKKLVWLYTRIFYNRCNLVLTPSAPMKKELSSHGIKRPIKVLSNGVDLKRFYPKKVRREKGLILHVGRISYEKNIDILIDAFKIVIKEYPNSKLLIVGGGPDLDKLKNKARKCKSIGFSGPVKHEKLVDIYSKADIFATASTIETEGIVILEAMACALPIVAVNALAVPHIVKDNINGLISKPYDEKGLAKNIITLLNDKKLRNEFSKKNLVMAKKFSLDYVVSELTRIYSSLKSE